MKIQNLEEKNDIVDISVIIPCFNEGVTIIDFLDLLVLEISSINKNFEIIVVDDASTDETLNLLEEYKTKIESDIFKITILSLKYNLGHQGAIYQGLLYAEKTSADRFIIMDGDGEDDPSAIEQLLSLQTFDIVHVFRGKRNESFKFKFFYYLYRFVFKSITNKEMNFGNYCLINRKILVCITDNSYIHFAAYLSKINATSTGITFDRNKRLNGESKMNFNSLMFHGLKSFIEYGDLLLLIFLKLFLLLGGLLIFSIVFIVYLKIFTNKAIMGWASTLSIGLFNAALISMGFFVLGILLINISNNQSGIRKEIFQVK